MSGIPISADFAKQLHRDGEGSNLVEDVDGVPMLMLAAPKKKKKKGKPAGDAGGGSGDRRREPAVPLSRAQRRLLKSKQRKLDNLEVRTMYHSPVVRALVG